MDINEKSHSQTFWLKLIYEKFGIINPGDYIEFEKRVDIVHKKFIDAYIPSTGIIIEQKSPGLDLEAAFVQAKNYYDWLPFSQRGRYIITCDFNEIHIHDMEEPTAPPQIIAVEDATKDNLSFLLTPGETRSLEARISINAGELIKKLYESLLDTLKNTASADNYSKAQYDKARDNINVFCVRLVFLLYAEDSGLFKKKQFQDYLKPRAIMADEALEKLFTVLKTPLDERPSSLKAELKAFPYVNGGLFADKVDFPQLDDDIVNMIIHDMSEQFNWQGISPVIFGAIFESTINDETRKNEGIHYTSPENIHKLIDPLFLDGLNETLNELLSEPESFERTQKLLAFQEKLAALRFLDPACGSGNFLTESFISIRRLENNLLAAIPESENRKVKVSITQFHGIEAHDFAVNVAKTALWISDHQMWKETQSIMTPDKPPLPLTDYHHIKHGRAMDTLPDVGWKLGGWNIHHDDMLYIMGNPPFSGYSKRSEGQEKEIREAFGRRKIDYVACWFKIAAEYIQDKNTKAAFVATNSLTQGEQVAYVFKYIRGLWPIKIDFAYQSFAWKNELPDPKKMAHVHVVIIAISTNPPELRRLYSADGTYRLVKNINFYLAEGPDEDIAEARAEPISENVPAMMAGNRPVDGVQLIIEGKEYADFIKREPKAEKYIKRYMMGDEFINNITRYCLWLLGASPQEIKSMPLVAERVKAVRESRLKSARFNTRKAADTPALFAEIRYSGGNYVAIPEISSESRKYIPVGFLDDSVIPGNSLRIIPDATLYDFGVLTSRVHMAWMRRIGGRFEMRYIYSNTVVYNTFAWPSPTPKQRAEIEKTAQEILDARNLYPDSSFAAMYDEALMPPELRHAHERNDRAVCRAYGWNEDISEEDIVAELFRLYHEIVG